MSEPINLTDVSITKSRWSVVIHGTDETGAFVGYIASADSALTQHDGIWFGTMAEYTEEVRGWAPGGP